MERITKREEKKRREYILTGVILGIEHIPAKCEDCEAKMTQCANNKPHCADCWGHKIETKEPCNLCD